jgi:DNA-binding transcriptional regulator YiaG
MKKERKKLYHYTQCGLDNIYLRNGVTQVKTPRGTGIHIQDPEGLHRAIGKMLVIERKYLDGKEFRFLRHELGLTQQSLAILLGVDVQSVARWEKNRTSGPIPGPAQHLIRLAYWEKINGNPQVIKSLERIAALDEILETEDEIVFEEDTKEGWQAAA